MVANITIPGMFLTGDHASRPAAGDVGSGSLYACSDHTKVYQSDGSSWSDWFDPTALVGGGSGQGLVDFGQVRYSGGDITASADNAYQDLGISDITLDASTGDVIEVGFSATANNSTSVVLSFDCVSIVSASPVNSIPSGAAQSNSNFGASCWLMAGGVSAKAAGSVMYTLQSGDISTGTVTLRMRVFVHSATNRVIDGDIDRPIHFWAKNLGPAI